MKVICWKCEKDFSNMLDSTDNFHHCPHCGASLDHGKVLEREGYEDEKQVHLYAPGQSKAGLPYQGWKIHVSANPAEAYLITEQILPKLIEKNVYHKVFRSRKHLEEEIEEKGTNQHKTVVIYPKVAEHLSHLTREFPDIGNTQFFIKSDKKNEEIRTERLKSIAPELNEFDLGKRVPIHWVNRFNINSNQPNARKILELLAELIENSDLSLAGGPSIPKSQDNEKVYTYNGKKTRISFRYDIIYGYAGVLLTDKRLLNKRKRVLKKNQDQWYKLNEYTKNSKKIVVGPYGSKLKSYREIHSVLEEDYFKAQWNYVD